MCLTTKMSLQSLENWHNYFKQNKVATVDIPWQRENDLSLREKSLIAKSIATFQLGEHSEGRHLLTFAAAYAQANDNPHIVPITKYFIAEEQNHARLLKKFMALHGIEALRKNWTDSVFRKLRKHLEFEVSVTVLITAEMLSLVFYDALKNATNSLLLKELCHKILRDEAAHIQYEAELLEYIRSRKSPFAKLCVRLLHGFLFSGTTLVVYGAHRNVIRRGGYNLTKFWSASWEVFDKYFSRKGLDSVAAVNKAEQNFLP